jgi:hypothetical protein
VGIKEVAYKERVFRAPETWKLEQDSIKVVAGPGGKLFITDLYEAYYPSLARVSWRRGAMIPMRRSKTTASDEGDGRSEGLYP